MQDGRHRKLMLPTYMIITQQIFTDIELKFGLVVAESHPGNII